ncbi:tachylectin-2-like isoform X2 [Dendropsophus ebraccatus]
MHKNCKMLNQNCRCLNTQLLAVTEEFDVKIAPVQESSFDFHKMAKICGKLNNVTNIACSPDRSLFCVHDGDLYSGPLPSKEGSDWFSTAKRVGRGGWDEFKTIFFHPNGVFYGTTINGDLYKGPKPSNEHVNWRQHVATKIGSGDWHEYGALFFHSNGDLYAVCKDDTLVKGKPPTGPGNWRASTTRIGKWGWLELTHFMAISPDGLLWCVSKGTGSLYKGLPPDHDDVNYIGLAQHGGRGYNMYKFLCFI